MTAQDTEVTGEDQLEPQRPDVNLPRLGPIGWARWAWRQLTSMRTALLLLMLLAVGAVPGSIIPQNRIDPSRVDAYRTGHPHLTPWLDKVGGFDVYGSPWFSAIYLLLFISLVGCVLPRSRQHWKALRSAPPRAPRRLERMPFHHQAYTDAAPEEVLAEARKVLKAKRFRVGDGDGDGDGSVDAERGHLAETGNLLFHLALLGILISVAAGSFVTYTGQKALVVGKSWANQIVYYDSFTPGRGVNTGDLPPFSMKLDSLDAKFRSSGSGFGTPSSFTAHVTVSEKPGDQPVSRTIRVNHPLNLSGANIYLVGNGYAPVITVRDRNGGIAYQGATPFLATDDNYTSDGVIKVLDGLTDKDGKPIQLGLQGQFLPTAVKDSTGRPVSVFPDATNPALIFTGWAGNLGLDAGTPQNVYQLDVKQAKQLSVDGQPFSASLARGQKVDLPDGLGSVTFDGVERYAGLEVRADPAKTWVLLFAVLALTGLTTSLFVRRRRVWVRAGRDGSGRTLVQVAGLPRRSGDDIDPEVAAIRAALVPEASEKPENPLNAEHTEEST